MLIEISSREELRNLLINRRVGVYCGLDPTAPSLHVGHMVPLMVLGWLYTHGYSVNYLVSRDCKCVAALLIFHSSGPRPSK